MLAMVAAADSASTVRKKYSVFIYSEAEPHAMYAIYKQTLTLCVLQYIHICIYIFGNHYMYLFRTKCGKDCAAAMVRNYEVVSCAMKCFQQNLHAYCVLN